MKELQSEFAPCAVLFGMVLLAATEAVNMWIHIAQQIGGLL
jgi:hypothetical protein